MCGCADFLIRGCEDKIYENGIIIGYLLAFNLFFGAYLLICSSKNNATPSGVDRTRASYLG